MKYESSANVALQVVRFPAFMSLNCFMKYMLFPKKILSLEKKNSHRRKKQTNKQLCL